MELLSFLSGRPKKILNLIQWPHCPAKEEEMRVNNDSGRWKPDLNKQHHASLLSIIDILTVEAHQTSLQKHYVSADVLQNHILLMKNRKPTQTVKEWINEPPFYRVAGSVQFRKRGINRSLG
jgi:hypothetical protein